MEDYTLAPGAVLHSVCEDKYKTDYFSLSFLTKLDERTASYGSLLAAVLKGGCRKYPGVAFVNRRLEELYGASIDVSVKKKGDIHIVTFVVDFVSDKYLKDGEKISDDVIGFVCDMIFDPLLKDGAFDRDCFETEKKNLLDLIAARINNKSVYALKRCEELMTDGVYELGVPAVVAAATPALLYEYYFNWLDTARIEAFAIGGIDAAAFAKALSRRLAPSRKPAPADTARQPLRQEICEYTEKYAVEQAKLSMSFTFDGDGIDYDARMLFMALYSASPTSLLFTNVRERLSLCYYCQARRDDLKMIMTVYSGVLQENIGIARSEILHQLERVKNADFTADELENARRTCINDLRALADSPARHADYMLTRYLLGCPPDIDAAMGRIDALTVQDVAAAASGARLDTVFVLCGEDK